MGPIVWTSHLPCCQYYTKYDHSYPLGSHLRAFFFLFRSCIPAILKNRNIFVMTKFSLRSTFTTIGSVKTSPKALICATQFIPLLLKAAGKPLTSLITTQGHSFLHTWYGKCPSFSKCTKSRTSPSCLHWSNHLYQYKGHAYPNCTVKFHYPIIKVRVTVSCYCTKTEIKEELHIVHYVITYKTSSKPAIPNVESDNKCSIFGKSLKIKSKKEITELLKSDLKKLNPNIKIDI